MDQHVPNRAAICFYEFVGSCILIMTINLGKELGVFQVPAVCLCVLACIANLAQVSGGHVNPSISAGVLVGYLGTPQWWTKFTTFICMFVSQTLGMVFGVVLVFAMSHTDEDNHLIYPEIAILCPGTAPWEVSDPNVLCNVEGRIWQAFLIEVICTFFYVTVCLSIIYYEGPDQMVGGIVIVFVLFSMIITASPISGGCINTAFGIVQPLF